MCKGRFRCFFFWILGFLVSQPDVLLAVVVGDGGVGEGGSTKLLPGVGEGDRLRACLRGGGDNDVGRAC